MRGTYTPLTGLEQHWANVKKAVRAAIRLKYQLLADEEINRVLPDVQAEFAKTLVEGRPFELDTDALLRGER